MTLNISRRQLLGTAGAAGVLAASGLPVSAAPKQGGVLKIGLGHGSTSDNLDPGKAANGFTIGMTYGVHNFLTEISPNSELVPELAESWEPSEGGKVWTFNLRKGVTFHDGAEFTAADVEGTLNYIRGEDSQSSGKVIVDPIETIEVVDKHTIRITLTGANADFPFSLSAYQMAILPCENGKPRSFQIGCGAYVVKSFEPGVRATLTKNPDYWKADKGHFAEVEMLSILDATARTNAILSGQVDVIDKVDLKAAPLMDRAPNINLHSMAGVLHYTYPMNFGLDPYSNVHVRQALKFGVDRQELVDKVLLGHGSLGNDHPIGTGLRYFNSELPQTMYDADKAKWHLKQADMEGVKVELSVSDAAYSGAIDAAQLYSNSAQKAGINLAVKRVSADGYWSNVWLKAPMCAAYWGGRLVEDQMFSAAYQSGVPWNASHFSDTRFDDLLIAARAELDSNKRREMYWEMQEILNTRGSTVIPMFANYVFATSTKIGHDHMASYWDKDGERWMERWWLV